MKISIIRSFNKTISYTGFIANNTFSTGTTMSNTNSLFGGNRFGSSTSGGLFSTSNTGGLGGFSSATTTNVVGTTIKFSPLLGTDMMIKNGNNQSINTRHQCITCMKEYENKSLEELRYEDYQANRKGNTSTMPMFGSSTNQTSNLFGTPSTSAVSFNTNQPTNSLFNTKPAFGSATTTAATTSIFNTTFNKSFSTNTNAFGSTQPTSLFGSTTTNTTTSGFGQPTNNLFNLNSQTAATNQVKPTSFFTNTTTQTNSLFSNTATNTNSLAKPSLFGTATPFGAPASSASTNFNFNSAQPATTSTSLFSNNQGTSLFGNNANTTANAQPKSMFNFSQNTGLGTQTNTAGQATSSLFGNTGGTLGTTNLGGTTNLFGNMGNTNTSSLFGNTNTAGTNLMGTTPLNQSNLLQPQITSPTGLQSSDLLMNRLQSLPYGSSSLFQLNKVGSPNSQASLKFTTDPKILNKYKVSFANNSSGNQVQRVPTGSIKNTSSLLFDGLDDENNSDEKKTSFNIFVPRKNIKKLTIKSKDNLNASSTSSLNNEEINRPQQQQSLNLQLTSNSSTSGTNLMNKKPNETLAEDNTVLEYFRQQPQKAFSSTPAAMSGNSENTSPNALPTIQSPGQSVIVTNKSNHHAVISSPETSLTTSLNSSQNYSILGPHYESGDCISPPAVSNSTYSVPRCKVILTRTEYFTVPPLEELEVVNDTCVVESFEVGRHGYGSIFWEGPLDIYGLNLDEVVHIRRKEVIVYPDDENKPGEGKI